MFFCQAIISRKINSHISSIFPDIPLLSRVKARASASAWQASPLSKNCSPDRVRPKLRLRIFILCQLGQLQYMNLQLIGVHPAPAVFPEVKTGIKFFVRPSVGKTFTAENLSLLYKISMPGTISFPIKSFANQLSFSGFSGGTA